MAAHVSDGWFHHNHQEEARRARIKEQQARDLQAHLQAQAAHRPRYRGIGPPQDKVELYPIETTARRSAYDPSEQSPYAPPSEEPRGRSFERAEAPQPYEPSIPTRHQARPPSAEPEMTRQESTVGRQRSGGQVRRQHQLHRYEVEPEEAPPRHSILPGGSIDHSARTQAQDKKAAYAEELRAQMQAKQDRQREEKMADRLPQPPPSLNRAYSGQRASKAQPEETSRYGERPLSRYADPLPPIEAPPRRQALTEPKPQDPYYSSYPQPPSPTHYAAPAFASGPPPPPHQQPPYSLYPPYYQNYGYAQPPPPMPYYPSYPPPPTAYNAYPPAPATYPAYPPPSASYERSLNPYQALPALRQEYHHPEERGVREPVIGSQLAREIPLHRDIASRQHTDDDTKAARSQQQLQYRRQLEEQMSNQKNKAEKEKQQKRAEEQRREQEAMNYNPWGREGAGAPRRDADGKIISNRRIAQALNTPHSMSANTMPPSPSADGAAEGMRYTEPEPHVEAVSRPAPGSSANQRAPALPPVVVDSPLKLPEDFDQLPPWQQDDVLRKAKQKKEIQDALREQMAQRDLQKQREKERKKEEDRLELEKLEKERKLLAEQYEKEQVAQRQKEAAKKEEAAAAEVLKKERQKIEAEAREAAFLKAKEEAEALRKARFSHAKSNRPAREEGEEEERSARASSPPLPTHTRSSQRASSPPLPTHARASSPPLPTHAHGTTSPPLAAAKAPFNLDALGPDSLPPGSLPSSAAPRKARVRQETNLVQETEPELKQHPMASAPSQTAQNEAFDALIPQREERRASGSRQERPSSRRRSAQRSQETLPLAVPTTTTGGTGRAQTFLDWLNDHSTQAASDVAEARKVLSSEALHRASSSHLPAVNLDAEDAAVPVEEGQEEDRVPPTATRRRSQPQTGTSARRRQWDINPAANLPLKSVDQLHQE